MIKLPKEKTIEGYTLSAIRALFFGPWGIGKSTFCSKFKNAIFIGTEKGLKGLDVHKLYVHNWEEFLEVVDKLLNTSHDFETVVIDTIDNAVKFCTIYSCDKYKVDHPSDMKWGKGWELFQREFETPILKLSVSDYGLIFTSHEKESEITKKGNIKILKIGPSFSNQARKIIGPFVDIIGHCYVDEIEVDGKIKERRYIEFEPTPYVEVKDRTGLLPASMPLRYVDFKKCFKEKKEE